MRPLLLALALAAPAAAEEVHDCLIEPFLVVQVGAPLEGVIASVSARRGARVAAGEEIARMESAVEEATLRMAEHNAASTTGVDLARARVDLLASEARRQRELANRAIVSAAQLEVAESELAQARVELARAEDDRRMAALDRDRAATQLERRTIRSPVDGIILRRLIGPGEYAHSQSAIAQIAAIDPLHVEVFLPTRLYGRIAEGQSALVRPAEPVGGEYRAVIETIDQVFDAASDTFGVRLVLPNPGERLPGGVDCTLVLAAGG
jgi:RND family efflux transporter MFP subunit